MPVSMPTIKSSWESVQERALSMAFPLLAYEEALIETGIPTLFVRREELCQRLFTTTQDIHKLHPLLPTTRTITHNQGNVITNIKNTHNSFKNIFHKTLICCSSKGEATGCSVYYLMTGCVINIFVSHLV